MAEEHYGENTGKGPSRAEGMTVETKTSRRQKSKGGNDQTEKRKLELSCRDLKAGGEPMKFP